MWPLFGWVWVGTHVCDLLFDWMWVGVGECDLFLAGCGWMGVSVTFFFWLGVSRWE